MFEQSRVSSNAAGFTSFSGIPTNRPESTAGTLPPVQLEAGRTNTSVLARIPVIGSFVALKQQIGRATARFAARIGVLPSSTRQIEPGTRLANAYGETASKHAIQRQQISVDGSKRTVDSLYRECPADKRAAGEPRVVLYLNSNSDLMGDHVLAYDSNKTGPIRMAEDLGAAVMMIDYGGTGASEGTPSSKGITQDVATALRYLTEEKGIDPKNIIVFGRSLGGAAALAGTDEFLKQNRNAAPPIVAVDRSFKTYASAARRSPGVKKATNGVPGLPTLIGKCMSLLGANMDSMARARSLRTRECKIIAIKNTHDREVTDNASFVTAASGREILHAEIGMTQVVMQHQAGYKIDQDLVNWLGEHPNWVENKMNSGQRLFIKRNLGGRDTIQEVERDSLRVDKSGVLRYETVDGKNEAISEHYLNTLEDVGGSLQMFFCDSRSEPVVNEEQLAQTFREKSADHQFCILIGDNWCPVEPHVNNGQIRVIGEENDRPLPDPIMLKTIDVDSDRSDGHNIPLQSDRRAYQETLTTLRQVADIPDSVAPRYSMRV